MSHSGKLGVVVKALLVGVMASASIGCAIHTQAPIREVAYDFSDRDFYDRAYAPSPQYLEAGPSYAAVASAGTQRGGLVGDEAPASTFVELSEIPSDAQ